jgi:glucan phosphoethanolaminetransferase (alkaline phosphatase superfamily)
MVKYPSLVRRLALLRTRLGVALLFLPAILVGSSDVARRWHRMARFGTREWVWYGAALVESAIVWGSLLVVGSRRRGVLRWLAATVFVALGAMALGSERYFFDQFETYLNADAVLFGAAFPASLEGQLSADATGLVSAALVPLLYFLAMVVAGRRWMKPSTTMARRASVVAPALLPIALVLPCSFRVVQAATPDVIWFHAMGGLAAHLARGKPTHVEPGVRRPPYVPKVTSLPSAPRNVLFILTESVRFDAVCAPHEADCKRSPFTDRRAPARIAFEQMRSNSSTTAISFGVLLSGLPPTETRSAIHTAPLLFDFAHAAGYDTAYWTSQHLMFAHSEEFVRDLPVSRRCGATDLDAEADIDMGARDELLTERVTRELGLLREPWFAIVHYSSTHFPYRVTAGDEPFQPASTSKAPDETEAFFHHYQNAVHAQDRTVADLLAALRATPAGARTVVLYTSDHGEAFREHGQLGHTGAVLDEEIHVPAWVDAPEATLLPAELRALTRARTELVWHVDVAPTILDLLGLYASPELAHFRSKMIGKSLLRLERTSALVPLTNCSELWGCAFKNWGLMSGPLKLEAREWDFDWHCWNVTDDPLEAKDLGPLGCAPLAEAARSLYGGLPRNAPEPPAGISQK